MKKVLALILSALMATTLFAGCSAPDDAGSDVSGGAKKTTLKVTALETAYGPNIWQKIKEEFEKQNEGVTVELTVTKTIEDTMSAEMKAGDYPDVVHLATGRPAAITETMIKDNALRDLSAVMDMTVPGEDVKVKDKILDGFLDTSLTNPYADGKTYLAPMFYGPCGLFYNAGLFESKGWTVPTTWDEMWVLGETAKKEGIALFTYPTTGYFDAFFYGMMYAAGGEDFFKKATTYSEGVWDTAEANKMFSVIENLAKYTDKTTVANANNENFQKNQQLVLDNKALFMPNGNWVIGEMKDAPRAEGFKWGFSALPAFEQGGDRYSYTFFEQVWSPKKAENPELADKFIAFLYSDTAVDIFLTAGTGAAVQPVKGVTDKLGADDKVMYGVYDSGEVKPALGAFAATESIEGVSMADSLFGTIDSIMNGSKTVAQWKEAVKKTSDQLRAVLK